MRISRRLGIVAIVGAAVLLTSCAAPASPVIAPVTKDVGDLAGSTVELIVGQTLNITTGDLAVDSYSAEIADPSIAEFVEGRDDGSATYNPGVKAVAVGSTGVVLSNTDGGIEDVTFTVAVTASQEGSAS
ncbi:MAG: hypothetical protein ABWX76_07830 [Leifsonia flava]